MCVMRGASFVWISESHTSKFFPIRSCFLFPTGLFRFLWPRFIFLDNPSHAGHVRIDLAGSQIFIYCCAPVVGSLLLI
jgi:hypothetical protein